MHVAVVGAGIGGLGTALGLARTGHRVTVVERDATPTPATAAEAFHWDRRGAPQVRHSHALLARLRNLLRDRHPDVLDGLHAAGVTEIRFADLLPETVLDRAPRPGDEDLVALAGRRTTLEWVLRRTVLAEPGVELLDGAAARGLAWDDAAGGTDGRPAVAGVQVESRPVAGRRAERRTIGADLVVTAGGRRDPVAGWVRQRGVPLVETEEDTGIVYFSRFRRLVPGAPQPPSAGLTVGNLGYLKYGLFPGDDRTFSLTLACGTADRELRSRLAHPETFDRVAGAIPTVAPWVDGSCSAPITGVEVMAGLVNRRRRYADDLGRPIVRRLVAVGDAHTCTNPLYGRGCSLAMVQASLLADALAGHADDLDAALSAYEAASAVEVLPWYRAAVAQDRMERERAEPVEGAADRPTGDGGADAAAPEEPSAPGAFAGLGRRELAALLRDGVAPAVRLDPVVYRAFVRMFNLLSPPDALLADHDVIGRVLAVYQDRDRRSPEPSLGPDRAELLAISRPPPPG